MQIGDSVPCWTSKTSVSGGVYRIKWRSPFMDL
jgi:hypothetical protein